MVLEEGDEEEEAEEEVVEEVEEEEEAAIRTMKEDSQITKIAKMKATPIPLDLAQILMVLIQTATMAIHVTIQVSKSQM